MIECSMCNVINVALNNHSYVLWLINLRDVSLHVTYLPFVRNCNLNIVENYCFWMYQ